MYSVIRTSGVEIVNVGVPVCVFPCSASEVLFSLVIETSVTVGVYVAVAIVPFLSTRLTVTAGATPTKFLSGVNVTVPSFATV